MSGWRFTNETVHALGVTLREPLTLGHILLLAEEGCPVVTGGDVLVGDVALAVFVCAYPHAVARRKLRGWGTSLLFRLWARFWKPGDDAKRFLEWFHGQLDLPPRWQSQVQGRGLCAPWWVNRVTLALNAGLLFTEAVDMPLRTANLLIASHLDATGAGEFLSNEQVEFFAMVKRQEATRRN